MRNCYEDSVLLDRIQKESDQDAYDILYLKYYSVLVGYASLFVSRQESEDLVQKVLLRFWEGRHQIKVHKDLSSYLFTAVRNACLDALKRRSVQLRAISDLHLSLIDSSADWNPYQYDELLALLRKALSELPVDQRIAFEMNRFEGKTYKEVAIELGISEKTVEYRISQALKKLKKDLADYLPLILTVMPSLFQTLRG